MNDALKRVFVSPAPETINDWTRKFETMRTLNDAIETYHLKLWDDDETYKDFLQAVWDEEAVEGSLAADNLMAATIIRQTATKAKDSLVSGKKLATIVKCLNVVMRRYRNSRKERRNRVGGENVPNDNTGE